jgi:AhpC/TSA antioxidant enzyme
VNIISVGLGSAEAGAEFAAQTGFPTDQLHADPTSACYRAMNFSPGALPGSGVSGYAKLLLMLAGIEAPGTMRVRPARRSPALSEIDTHVRPRNMPSYHNEPLQAISHQHMYAVSHGKLASVYRRCCVAMWATAARSPSLTSIRSSGRHLECLARATSGHSSWQSCSCRTWLLRSRIVRPTDQAPEPCGHGASNRGTMRCGCSCKHQRT